MTMPPNPNRWVRLKEAAAEIGVSGALLSKWVTGRGYSPEMPSRKDGNAFKVQPSAAYEHLKEHGSEIVRKKLTKPNGYNGPAVKETPQIPKWLTDDLPIEAITPVMQREMGTELWRMIKERQVEIRQKAKDQAKLDGLIEPDRFVQLLRESARIFIEHMEIEGSKRLAQRLIAVLKERFTVNLSKHAGASSVLESVILEDLNVGLSEFRVAIDERCAAVEPKGD